MEPARAGNRRPGLLAALVRSAPGAMAEISEADFRRMFGGTPVTRARYSGFLRNVAIAMGNQGRPNSAPPGAPGRFARPPGGGTCAVGPEAVARVNPWG